MTLTTVLDIQRERAALQHDLEQRGRLTANMLNEALADPLYFSDIDELGDIAKIVQRQPDVTTVQVFAPDGRLLVDAERENYPVDSVQDEFVLSALSARQTEVRFDGDTLRVVRPVMAGTEVIGGVQLGFDLASIEREIRDMAISRVWQTVALVALGVVVSYLMALYFVRPIRRLVEATRRIAQGDFGFSYEMGRSDEIGALMRAFSDMTQALEAARARITERTNDLRAANQQLEIELTERKGAEETIQHLAYHDDLTDLPNRRLFN